MQRGEPEPEERKMRWLPFKLMNLWSVEQAAYQLAGVSGGLVTNLLSSSLIPKDQPNFSLPHLLRREFRNLSIDH